MLFYSGTNRVSDLIEPWPNQGLLGDCQYFGVSFGRIRARRGPNIHAFPLFQLQAAEKTLQAALSIDETGPGVRRGLMMYDHFPELQRKAKPATLGTTCNHSRR